jgi:hypothetical protein
VHVPLGSAFLHIVFVLIPSALVYLVYFGCLQGCATCKAGKVTDKNKFCKVDASKREGVCTNDCKGASSDPTKQGECDYGCTFWK